MDVPPDVGAYCAHSFSRIDRCALTSDERIPRGVLTGIRDGLLAAGSSLCIQCWPRLLDNGSHPALSCALLLGIILGHLSMPRPHGRCSLSSKNPSASTASNTRVRAMVVDSDVHLLGVQWMLGR